MACLCLPMKMQASMQQLQLKEAAAAAAEAEQSCSEPFAQTKKAQEGAQRETDIDMYGTARCLQEREEQNGLSEHSFAIAVTHGFDGVVSLGACSVEDSHAGSLATLETDGSVPTQGLTDPGEASSLLAESEREIAALDTSNIPQAIERRFGVGAAALTSVVVASLIFLRSKMRPSSSSQSLLVLLCAAVLFMAVPSEGTATAVYVTDGAGAAVLDDGRLVTWGDAGYGGDSSSVASQLTNVQEVVTTSRAFGARKSDGSVVVWGDSGYAGDASSLAAPLSSGVTKIVSGFFAMAALKSDGSVVAWGNSGFGGDTSSVAAQLTSGCVGLYSNKHAFVVLKSDGSAVTWGSGAGLTSPEDITSLIDSTVTEILGSHHAFAALRADGRVVTWGDVNTGGDSRMLSSQLSSGVMSLHGGSMQFAALKSDGTALVWGMGPGGSTWGEAFSSAKSFAFSHTAVAIVFTDGTVASRGNTNDQYGADSSAVSAQLTDVDRIYGGWHASAFIAVKSNGDAVVWGHPTRGGDASGVDLCCVQAGFGGFDATAILKTDGSVVAFGESANGGNTQHPNSATDVTSGVTTIAIPPRDG
ncbi:unnamed protein product, partial [Symbiodinium necroappetens]